MLRVLRGTVAAFGPRRPSIVRGRAAPERVIGSRAMRGFTPFVAVAFLAAGLCFAGSAPEVPPVPAVLPAKPEEAKKATDEAEKAAADKNDEALAKALGDMEGLASDTFAPFIRAGMASKTPSVVAASLRAAAANEMKEFEKDARKLLHVKTTKKETKDGTALAGEVGAGAIDYLARLGFGGEETTVVDDYLVVLITPTFGDANRITSPWANDLVRASVHYVGKFKAKHAAAVLIDLLTVPEKKPLVNGKNPNPPDAYFTARDKLNRVSEGWVRWALKEITGQEYRSPREWEAWLKANKKEYK
jgi:hypothetical protein